MRSVEFFLPIRQTCVSVQYPSETKSPILLGPSRPKTSARGFGNIERVGRICEKPDPTVCHIVEKLGMRPTFRIQLLPYTKARRPKFVTGVVNTHAIQLTVKSSVQFDGVLDSDTNRFDRSL